MLTSLVVLVPMVVPILVLVALLKLAAWRDETRREVVARQIALTDAIGRELGAIVAPVVRKRPWGPWQIEIAVPLARPAIVGTILAIADRALAVAHPTARDYRIILTPQEDAIAPRGRGGHHAPHAKAA